MALRANSVALDSGIKLICKMCKIKFSYIAFLALIDVIFSFCFSQYALTASSNFQPVQSKIAEEIEENEEDKGYLSVFYGNALIQSNNPITIKSEKIIKKTVISKETKDKVPYIIPFFLEINKNI